MVRAVWPTLAAAIVIDATGASLPPTDGIVAVFLGNVLVSWVLNRCTRLGAPYCDNRARDQERNASDARGGACAVCRRTGAIFWNTNALARAQSVTTAWVYWLRLGNTPERCRAAEQRDARDALFPARFPNTFRRN